MGRGMRRLAACVVVVLALAPGCASRTKTITTEQRAQYPAETVQQPAPPVVVERETVQTTTVITPKESHGVLSTIVHLVGEVIALPFRLLGGLVRLLF